MVTALAVMYFTLLGIMTVRVGALAVRVGAQTGAISAFSVLV